MPAAKNRKKTQGAKSSAEEMGKKAYGTAKEATVSAWEAVKVVFSDPMGGQGKALKMMDKKRALSAGVLFAAFFVITFWLFSKSLMFLGVDFFLDPGRGGGLLGQHIPRPELSFGDHIKLLFMGLIPPVALAACYFGLGRWLKELDLGAVVFASGLALLPLSIALLLMWALNLNLNLHLAFLFFATCMSLLLINGLMLEGLGTSTKRAFFLSPTTLLVTLIVTRIVWSVLF